MKLKLELPQRANVNLFFADFCYSHNGLSQKGGTACSLYTRWFSLSTVSRQNQNLECWYLWREENQRIRRQNFGARIITNNKLHSHVTPGPEIEPGPQQQEAIPLTNTTSLLPFSTVILCKITCCTFDLPLSMLSNESFLLHAHLYSRIGLVKTKFHLLCVGDLQYQNNFQFPVTGQLEVIQTKNNKQHKPKGSIIRH